MIDCLLPILSLCTECQWHVPLTAEIGLTGDQKLHSPLQELSNTDRCESNSLPGQLPPVHPPTSYVNLAVSGITFHLLSKIRIDGAPHNHDPSRSSYQTANPQEGRRGDKGSMGDMHVQICISIYIYTDTFICIYIYSYLMYIYTERERARYTCLNSPPLAFYIYITPTEDYL